MKNLLIAFIATTTLTSCSDMGNSYSTTFDSSFPKKNKYLANILGDELTIKSGKDTLSYRITSNKNTNLIVDSKSGDTVFIGTVSKFRNLYYFSHQLNDSSYLIHAVKVSDKLIYGLSNCWMQYWMVDEAIRNGKNKELVKYMNADSTIIRLHPEKRDMKKLFSYIINNVKPDTILSFDNSYSAIEDNPKNEVKDVDAEENNYIFKVFPNPTTDIVTVELQQKGELKFQLSDINGKLILQGEFNELLNKIDISKQKKGSYILKIMNEEAKESETIKIVKLK